MACLVPVIQHGFLSYLLILKNNIIFKVVFNTSWQEKHISRQRSSPDEVIICADTMHGCICIF